MKALREGILDNNQESPKAGLKLGDLLKEIDSAQISCTEPLAADSIQSAVFQGQVRLNAEEDTKVRVDIQFLRTPVAVKSNDQLELVAKVSQATTLTQAQDIMTELQPSFEKPVFEILNKRFGTNLLRTAQYQFQFDEVERLNFTKNYGRFLNTFKDLRGDAEAAQFAQRVGNITTLSSAHVNAEDMQDFAGDLLAGVQNAKALVFLDVLAVVSLQATIDELGIGKVLEQEDKGMAVTQSSNRDLHTVLRGLYTQVEQAIPAGLKPRVLLSTSDNRLVEVLPFACRVDSFILASV
jgi:hypothetical protein